MLATTPPPITNEALWGKLLELESFLAGRGVDLLTPNQVYSQYGVHHLRLSEAVEKKSLHAYDRGCEARGGRKSYKVRRADVIRVFDLPPLPEDIASADEHAEEATPRVGRPRKLAGNRRRA